MIMLRTAAIWFTLVTYLVAAAAAVAEEEGQQQQDATTDGTTSSSNNVTAIAARFLGEYVTPTVCTYAPDYCTKHELHSSRGLQSYLATAGTLFAGVLGIILTKIKILVIVSLITMIIGKILLFYAFIKTELVHHHKPHHVPFVKYTKDKYYIKHSPIEHTNDVYIEPDSHHSPYHGHASPSSGVSYYRR